MQLYDGEKSDFRSFFGVSWVLTNISERVAKWDEKKLNYKGEDNENDGNCEIRQEGKKT